MGGGVEDVEGNSGAAGFDTPSDIGARTRTAVLVGRTGNGKSTTANSIVGRTSFTSRPSSFGVREQCQLESTRLNDGQNLNVIDTPGIFDLRGETDIEDQIIECVRLAKDGIHAVLLVFSARGRFSEEEFALRCLHDIFGEKMIDYVIVVFTGGDELEEAGVTLDQFLGSKCPDGLKHILEPCENRRVLLDNKTKDEVKKAEQLQELLGLIDAVVAKNGGQAYAYAQGLIADLKKREMEHKLQMKFGEKLRQLTEMVAARLKETISWLEKQLAEKQAARLEAEKIAQAAQTKSNDEIQKLREKTEELRRRAESDVCAIL